MITRRVFLKSSLGVLASIYLASKTVNQVLESATFHPRIQSVPVSTIVTVESKALLNEVTSTNAVTISGLEDGLSGFDFILNSSKGLSITNIVTPAYGIVTVDVLTPNSTQIRAVDLSRLIEGTPSEPFELFTFDLTAVDVGGTQTVTILPVRLDDDSGFPLIPLATFLNGSYDVNSPLTDYKFSNITHPNGNTTALVRFYEGDIKPKDEENLDDLGGRLISITRYRRITLLREMDFEVVGRVSDDDIRNIMNAELVEDLIREPIEEQKGP